MWTDHLISIIHVIKNTYKTIKCKHLLLSIIWSRSLWDHTPLPPCAIAFFAVLSVFWKTGSRKDQHFEEYSVDSSQPSLSAVRHQRWGYFNSAASLTVGTSYHHISAHLTVCVYLTQLYEDVRKSLEQCNIQEDIEHFINLRRTGDKPPGTVIMNLAQVLIAMNVFCWRVYVENHITRKLVSLYPHVGSVFLKVLTVIKLT